MGHGSPQVIVSQQTQRYAPDITKWQRAIMNAPVVKLPTKADLRTLRAIEKIGTRSAHLRDLDLEPCIKAGWVLSHPSGYALTGSGREVLRRHPEQNE